MSTEAPESTNLTWNIDSAHSSIDFSVKHMGVFTVRGSLGTVSGTATTEGGTLKSVALSVDMAGVTTNNEQRDGHLKSPDFFNVAEHPTITFTSTAIVKRSDTDYTVTGDLQIIGTSKSITVDTEIHAPVKDPWGGTRSGATAAGSLSRKEWGLTYNSVMDTGHLMLSDEVKFTFDIQAVVA